MYNQVSCGINRHKNTSGPSPRLSAKNQPEEAACDEVMDEFVNLEPTESLSLGGLIARKAGGAVSLALLSPYVASAPLFKAAGLKRTGEVVGATALIAGIGAAALGCFTAGLGMGSSFGMLIGGGLGLKGGVDVCLTGDLSQGLMPEVDKAAERAREGGRNAGIRFADGLKAAYPEAVASAFRSGERAADLVTGFLARLPASTLDFLRRL